MTAVISQLNVVPQPKQDRSNSKARQVRARQWSTWVVREPFVQFLLLGLLVWAGVNYWSAERDRYVIHLGSAERQRIADTYAQQFGQMPTAQQLEGLVERYVREEIYWREGLALKLDQEDEIGRRRIVQKYEFLRTDLGVTDTPSDAELQRWFQQSKGKYLSPERTGFTHVFFSVDSDGEAAAKSRAVKVLEKLRATRAAGAAGPGDPFPGPAGVSALAQYEAGRLFGRSELAEKLFELPIGKWAGPFRSGYGWHLVYVTGRSPPTLPSLVDIRPQVLADYQDEQRRLSNARMLEELKAKYTIRDDGVRG